jgi:hypothetical protein
MRRSLRTPLLPKDRRTAAFSPALATDDEIGLFDPSGSSVREETLPKTVSNDDVRTRRAGTASLVRTVANGSTMRVN